MPIKLLVISVVILFSFSLFFLSPKLKVLKSIKEDLKNIENELLETKVLLENVELPMEEEKKKWDAVKARIDTLSAGIKLHELTGILARLARTYHIPEVSFSNARNAPAFKLSEPRFQLGDYLIKMSFDCQYRNLAYFLKGLDDMALGAIVESLEAKKMALPLIHAELQVRPLGMKK